YYFATTRCRKNKCYSRFVLYKRKIMTHTYHIHGMTCNGCRAHVEHTLSQVEGVSKASVDLEKAEATIEMESHISLETFNEALEKDGGSYSIHAPGHHDHEHHDHDHGHQHDHKNPTIPSAKMGKGKGVFYCPMHCEGDKTYDGPGDCPVCGMDLVEEVSLASVSAQQWTCPMHPEIVRDEPGACPICGMDLVPLQPSLSAEEENYNRLSRKFWI